jgi:von Willebrand factor type A domain
MRTSRKSAAGIAAIGLAAALWAAPTTHAACVGATNVEAIVDDSGSMAATDPDALRVKALKLLINTLPSSTLLGAVEFGSSFDPSLPSADTVFPSEAVGANATAMGDALDQKIVADNGGTDYNAAFAQSDADNPGAQARIFLTDGGHNVGDYNNGHLTHKVPTYVIGFSTAALDPDAAARLQAIANDTGGHYYSQTDSSQLQSVMNSIGASLTCQQPPKTFTDQLKQGQSKSHGITVRKGVKSLQIALTWSSPLDTFTISKLRLVQHGRTVAVASRKHKPRKLRVKTTKSATFTLLKVSRLAKGKLKFKVTAKTIDSGAPQVRLVTQVSPRKH